MISGGAGLAIGAAVNLLVPEPERKIDDPELLDS